MGRSVADSKTAASLKAYPSMQTTQESWDPGALSVTHRHFKSKSLLSSAVLIIYIILKREGLCISGKF